MSLKLPTITRAIEILTDWMEGEELAGASWIYIYDASLQAVREAKGPETYDGEYDVLAERVAQAVDRRI